MKNRYLKPMEYELIEKRIAYQGKRLKVEEACYFNGNEKIYREHVIPGDAAVILPITKEGNIIMIAEPRTAVNKVVLGLPAGQIDKGENFEECAIRELEEETGYRARKIKKLREVYPSVGYTSEKIEIYLAEDLEKTQRHLDDTEDIDVIILSKEKVKELLEKNQIIVASTTIALMHYFMYEDK